MSNENNFQGWEAKKKKKVLKLFNINQQQPTMNGINLVQEDGNKKARSEMEREEEELLEILMT